MRDRSTARPLLGHGLIPAVLLAALSAAACRDRRPPPPAPPPDRPSVPDASVTFGVDARSLGDAAPPADDGPRATAAPRPDLVPWAVLLRSSGTRRLVEIARASEPGSDEGVIAAVLDDGQQRLLVAATRPDRLIGRLELPRVGERVTVTLGRPLPHREPIVSVRSQRRQADIVDTLELWARAGASGLETIARREETRVRPRGPEASGEEAPPDENVRLSEERARRVKAGRALAAGHETAGRTIDALAAWREVIDADGADARARAHIGRLLLGLGRSAEARRELELAIELGDRRPRTLEALCRALRAQRSPAAEAVCATVNARGAPAAP